MNTLRGHPENGKGQDNSSLPVQAILDSALDAFILMDADGKVVAWNPQAEVTFGWPARDVIGQRLAELIIPHRLRERHLSGFERYLATGDGRFVNRRVELTAVRRSGEEFPVELAITPLRVEGRVMFSAFLRDITRRKKAAEDLRRADEQLLAHTRELEARNAELVRSNQELDDFAYIASHDLKEPLRGIRNFASFLLEDYAAKLDDAGMAKLETLTRLSERLDSLLDSLLQFSRVGRVELALKTTDLNAAVAEVLESLTISVQERRVQVRIPRPLPTLMCDGVRVREVYRNLVANAVKYNDKPEKWIEIGWQMGRPPVLFVRDNGIGIREKHFEAVFRIFKRLHGRDQFGGGTGAGLTIARKIVERHGGRLWVESVFGEGSTFFFTLANGEGSDHVPA